MQALALFCIVLQGMAWGTDVDAWAPGGQSGHLDDPLSGHGGTVLSAGGGVASGWGQVTQGALDAYRSNGTDPGWQPALELYGSAGAAGSWRPHRWSQPAALGARLRARVVATETLSALGSQSAGPALDTAALWVRRGLSSPARMQQAVFAEALVDFDGWAPEEDGLSRLSGPGTGVSAGWAARLGTPGRALSSSLSVSGTADLRSKAVAPQAARGTLEARMGAAVTASSVAGLAEVHARLAWHAPLESDRWAAASLEPRVGVRGQAGPRVQWLALVGGGVPFLPPGSQARVQPTGSPDLRVGGELRWLSRARGPTPLPARSVGPGSLVVAPRSATGTVLPARVEHPDAWRQPDGSVVVPHRPGETVTVTADGHATLSLAPLVAGEGPWSWRPVLPTRTGDARVAVRLLDEQEQAVALRSLSLAGGAVGPPVGGTQVVLDGVAAGAVEMAASGVLVQQETVALEASSRRSVQTVHLRRPVGATRVAVVGDGDVLVGARVLVTSAVGFSELRTDRNGLVETRLAAGAWTVRVEADGFAAQEQTVEIGAKRGRLHGVVFALLRSEEGPGRAIEVTLIDPTGAPVEGGEVRLGDQRLGETASGGRLLLEGVGGTETKLTVDAARFEPYAGALQAVQGTEAQSILVPLRWRPGQVEVEARATNGNPIPDAVVFVSRPDGEPGEPLALGPDGLARLEVPLGDHRITVTAPNHTRVSLPLSVDEDRETLFRVQATLEPESPEPASLRVQVSSSRMAEVEGAELHLDGTAVALSSPTGLAVVEGLAPGEHSVEIRHAVHEPWSGTVRLSPDAEQTLAVELTPRTGLLEVSATHNGAPVPALVRLLGPETRRPMSLGPDGIHVFALPAAPWEVLLSSEQFGVAAFDVLVRADRDSALSWVPAGSIEASAMERLSRVPLDVVVTERGTGEPVSATVRMLGPEVRPPAQTDSQGRLRTSVLPGFWEVIATSPRLGIGGTDVEVHRRDALAEAEVTLGSALVEVETGRVRLREEVRFETGSARIAGTSKPLLDALARTLILSPELRRVRVEGHTDATGDPQANQRLSEARAASVVSWLVRAGVTPDRLQAQGFGASRPAASNADDAGRRQNRRVVVRIEEREAVGASLVQ